MRQPSAMLPLSFAVASALRPAVLQASAKARSTSSPPSVSLRPRGGGDPLLSAAAPAPVATLANSIVAGGYTGVIQFTFAAACAAVVFGPVGLPLAIRAAARRRRWHVVQQLHEVRERQPGAGFRQAEKGNQLVETRARCGAQARRARGLRRRLNRLNRRSRHVD